MSGKPRNPEDELRRVFEALAESAVGMSEDEALADAQAEGIDPKAEANRLRALAKVASETVRLRAQREAKERHRRDQAALTGRSWPLPDTPQARRALLAKTFEQHPALAGLTAAARDLTDVPDDDVESQLRDLAALGALGDDVKE